MDIIPYDASHREFRARLRSFLAAAVTPHVDRWEKEGIVPRSVWREMGRAGFLCMSVSPEYGGLGADFRHSVIIAETAMAKYWTTEMVKRVADRRLDLLGDAGTLESCPAARAWRDVRVMSIFAGTNEIMKGIAAKLMGF